MYKTSDLPIGADLSITIYGAIGGINTFSGVVVGHKAGKYLNVSANAHINHSNIYPTIPEEERIAVADDFQSYNYVEIFIEGSDSIFVGHPWIRPGTLVVNDKVIRTVSLEDPFDDATQLSKVLTSAGYIVNSVA